MFDDGSQYGKMRFDDLTPLKMSYTLKTMNTTRKLEKKRQTKRMVERKKNKRRVSSRHKQTRREREREGEIEQLNESEMLLNKNNAMKSK